MDKENIIILVKDTLFQQLEKSRKGLSGIYRVCQDALRPGQTTDRSAALWTGNGIATANAVIFSGDADICLQQFRRPGSQFHGDLSEGIITNADANGAGSGQEKFSPQSQARVDITSEKQSRKKMQEVVK